LLEWKQKCPHAGASKAQKIPARERMVIRHELYGSSFPSSIKELATLKLANVIAREPFDRLRINFATEAIYYIRGNSSIDTETASLRSQ
jgi:hypothetical protein